MALFNIEKKHIKQDLDCIDCSHFDKQEKRCKGIGVACFEFDKTTQTCLDPITHLPFNPNEQK